MNLSYLASHSVCDSDAGRLNQNPNRDPDSPGHASHILGRNIFSAPLSKLFSACRTKICTYHDASVLKFHHLRLVVIWMESLMKVLLV